MLQSLSIHDVVLIDHLTLTLAEGFSVLTGETGAGKSILLDALGLVLGARAEGRLIRQGASQASVVAAFSLDSLQSLKNLLKEQGIPLEEETLYLKRLITVDGKSRAFINDEPVSLNLLKRVGALLVEVHSQFDSFSTPSKHRNFVDQYAGVFSLKEELRHLYSKWQGALENLEQAQVRQESLKERAEFLKEAIRELTSFKPQRGEEESLLEKRTFLMHKEKFIASLKEADEALNKPRPIDQLLHQAYKSLLRAKDYAESQISPLLEALDRADAELKEAFTLLENLQSVFEVDTDSLETVENRLFELRNLARKYGCIPDDLSLLLEGFMTESHSLEASENTLEGLLKEAQEARNHYLKQADLLSKARFEAAKKIQAAVEKELPSLKLKDARFEVPFTELLEEQWGGEGKERLEFYVSMNPGLPLGPLGSIASGGELSRLMLVLRAVLAGANQIPTLIFDEIDTGIGGAVAAAVGEKLALLAKGVQVLSITHSPQVAAWGEHHFHVSKESLPGGVRTTVYQIEENARAEEIARMLSGHLISEEARQAAVKILESSKI